MGGFEGELFQSHAGSIEACCGENRFPFPSGFNPTLVRLRRVQLRAKEEAKEMFQSHAGSIEALSRAQLRWLGEQSFNPTLVRLRLVSEFIMDRYFSSFNPTLVRLRRMISSIRCPRFSCFNPTLVRLRPHPKRSPPGWPPLFQSHAGSIEARQADPWAGYPKVFQSHAGSIEASGSSSWYSKSSGVSIPRWFD